MKYYIYTVDQWILLFFAYGIIGYLWEIAYVSVRSHKFCNRGFMYGPILPIYGFGAITILYATLPVRESIPLVFLLGTISASLLEFFTGYVMEKIFRIRYWDYSQDILNIKGYVCLRASFAWGVFSVLLTEYIHPYFDIWVCRFSVPAAGIISHAGALIFAADLTMSIRQALDLRALIIKYTEENEMAGRAADKLRRIKTAADAAIAYTDMNQNGIPDVLEDMHDKFKEKLVSVLKRNPSATINNIKNEIEELRKRQ